MLKERIEKKKKIFDIFKYENYDQFENIVIDLNKKFEVEVSKKMDGPDSRVWFIEINKYPYTLHNNHYGNCLKPLSIDAEMFVERNLELFNAVL